MKEHLESDQLPKCGLRFFLPAGDNGDITKRSSSARTASPRTPTTRSTAAVRERAGGAAPARWGWTCCRAAGSRRDLWRRPAHGHASPRSARAPSTKARWVVDAAGRASLLKRKLGLAKEVGHTINSAWFRLAGGLDIEDFGRDNAEWMGKMSEPGIRKFSTNHLLGEGYWVWLIPLSTGPISIGVCADPRFHPFEEISRARADGGVARQPRAPAGGCRRAAPRPGRGLPARRGLRLRRRAGVLARPLVPGGRGRRLRRPATTRRART